MDSSKHSTNGAEQLVQFRSYDGVQLEGLYQLSTDTDSRHLVVLLHGIGGNRDEHGLNREIASAVTAVGGSSFRYDWRCHGYDVERPPAELTLSGLYNDITAGVETALRRQNDATAEVSLVANSFAGASAVYWASRNSTKVANVILLSPVLDYVEEYLNGEGFLEGGGLSAAAQDELNHNGELLSQSRLFSRGMCNEMRAFPKLELSASVKYWILHGDKDSSVNIEQSVSFARSQLAVKLLVVGDAEHGFVDPLRDDLENRTRELHASVGREIARIVTTGEASGRFSSILASKQLEKR